MKLPSTYIEIEMLHLPCGRGWKINFRSWLAARRLDGKAKKVVTQAAVEKRRPRGNPAVFQGVAQRVQEGHKRVEIDDPADVFIDQQFGRYITGVI